MSRDAKCLQVVHHQSHIVQTSLGGGIGVESLILKQAVEQLASTLVHDIRLNPIRNAAIKTLIVNHLLAHIRPRHLIQLIDGTGDRPDLVLRHTADGKDTVQNLAVVDLDRVAAVPSQLLEDLANNAQHLGIGNHRVEGTGDIEVTLVELAHPALADGGLITTVHLGDVVPLDAADIRVHGEPAGKGHGQVVAQRADLTTLVLQVVDELGVLAILASQDLAQLKDRGIEGGTAVALEDVRRWW